MLREKLKLLDMDEKLMNRSVNEAFSGGEKKRNEILQMAVLEPKLAILDETDSGLDIDALRIVAQGVNAMRSPDRAMLVVTHYQRLLNYIVPDYVHVLVDGRIVRSGGPELALELEDKGYGTYRSGSGRASPARDENYEGAIEWQQQAHGNCKITQKASADSRNPLRATSLSWLRKLRQDAFARFSETGFPTTRDEDWRFTNPAAIAQTHFPARPQRPFPALAQGARAISNAGRRLPAGFRRRTLCAASFRPSASCPPASRWRASRRNSQRNPGAIEPHLGRYLDTSARCFRRAEYRVSGRWRVTCTSPRARSVEEPIACSSFQPRTMRRR